MHPPLPLVLFVAFLLSGVATARAAGRVELTLATEPDAPLGAQQTWVRALGQAGVRNVRIRQQRGGDQVGIETTGAAESPIHVVTGLINGRGEILLPGARFREGEAGRVAQWLDDLARRGPPDSREKTGAFGLPRSQLDAVRKALTPPVGFSTQKETRGDIIRKMREQLGLPLEIDAAILAALDKDVLGEELQGMSRGAALAHVLRGAGFGLIPRTSARGPVLVVGEPLRGETPWPIGWPPETTGAKAAPSLFEFHEINVDNVSVSKILEAIGARTTIPILIDPLALARHRIDPTQVLVTLPRGQTTYMQVLRKAAFQARLKCDVLVDEAGNPLLWITSLKPVP